MSTIEDRVSTLEAQMREVREKLGLDNPPQTRPKLPLWYGYRKPDKEITVSDSQTLAKLLTDKSVQPGTCIWVLPGEYSTPDGSLYFRCTLMGTQDAPIYVRGLPGQPPKIKPGIWADPCAYTIFWGLEICSDNPKRTRAANEAYPRVCGLNLLQDTVNGQPLRGKSAINCIVHDVGHPGIGIWNQGQNGQVYGNLVYNCGLYDSSPVANAAWQRGAGVYGHNDDGALVIAYNIFIRNMQEGVHAYSASGGAVPNVVVQNNIAINNWGDALFVGDDKGAINNALIGANFVSGSIHKRAVRIGYGQPVVNGILYMNRISSRATNTLWLEQITHLDMEDNVILHMGDLGATVALAAWVANDGTFGGTWTLKNNGFLTDGDRQFVVYDSPTGYLHGLQSWKDVEFGAGVGNWAGALGVGSDGKQRIIPFTVYNGRDNPVPSGLSVTASWLQNAYDLGRWHLAVWNPLQEEQYTVKAEEWPDAIKGCKVTLYDAQNWGVPVWTGVAGQEDVTLNLHGAGVAPFVGDAPTMDVLLQHGDPTLNAYIVQADPSEYEDR